MTKNNMKEEIIRYKLSLFLVAVSLTLGCSAPFQSVLRTKASLGYPSGVHSDLISLPPPKEKIVAAIYRFQDLTGQYKYFDTGVSWSTAVTQGATSMLIKAFDDSGWFTVLEREGISNLLTERKIISSTREQYRNSQGEKLDPLPPLLYAGVLIEGGIISYEINTVTGGFGARYFGLGGSTDIRKDEVTIYLRAISTQTGEVLKIVNTTKSILSQKVAVNLYRYVKVNKLLEIESGYSTNEPPNMCVLEAIEKAVQSLIIDGIFDNFWALKDSSAVNSPVIQAYLREKELNFRPFDDFKTDSEKPNISNVGKNKIGLGFDVSAQNYAGDYPDPEICPAGNVFLRYGLNERFSLALNGGYGEFADKDNFDARIINMEIRGIVSLFPRNRLNIYLLAGGGAVNYWAQDKQGNKFKRKMDFQGWGPAFLSGIGIEYFINKSVGVNMTLDHHFTFSDTIDGIIHGNKNDNFWNAKLGLTYYFEF